MDIKNTNNYKFNFKLMVIFLSFISPLVMYFSYGKIESLSAYWFTPFQPLFIITNMLTTYVFMSLPKWKLSGIFLFLLTVFSLEFYDGLHDILALLFFLVNIYPLYSLQRYRLFLVPYLLSCVWLPDLFWFEVQAISVLCIYHLNLVLKVKSVLNNN